MLSLAAPFQVLAVHEYWFLFCMNAIFLSVSLSLWTGNDCRKTMNIHQPLSGQDRTSHLIPEGYSVWWCHLTSIGITIINIKLSHDYLIFVTEFCIHYKKDKTVYHLSYLYIRLPTWQDGLIWNEAQEWTRAHFLSVALHHFSQWEKTLHIKSSLIGEDISQP